MEDIFREKKEMNKKNFLAYDDAKKIIHLRKIKSWTEWQSLCKENKIPKNIPKDPGKTYKNKGWTNWGDFLGTGTIANKNKKHRSFRKASQFARSLKLKSRREWDDFCKSSKKPDDIPQDPVQIYKNKGWKGFGDWLGTGYVANMRRQFISYTEAKKYARSLKLKNGSEWRAFCKTGKIPKDIPKDPQKSFKKGWKSWRDFLGTDNIANKKRQLLSFKQAREEARRLAKYYKIKTANDWIKACRTGLIPKSLPANPWITYSKKRKNEKTV